MTGADSAGRPWSGRAFEASGRWDHDDGSAPPTYTAALAAFRSGTADQAAVIDALRDARLLVPLLAGLAEADRVGGRVVDKRAELSLVTVAGPDGRRVLPAFSSSAAMRAWNPDARPIPAPAPQVALGAAADGTELVIVDPASPDRFGLRRGGLEALARGLPWTPPWADPAVRAAIRAAFGRESDVVDVAVEADDPLASFEGAEVRVVLVLRPGLALPDARELVARVERRWTEDEAVRQRVDSMRVRLRAG